MSPGLAAGTQAPRRGHFGDGGTSRARPKHGCHVPPTGTPPRRRRGRRREAPRKQWPTQDDFSLSPGGAGLGGAWSARGSHPVCSKPPSCTPRGSRRAPGTCGWVVGKGQWELGAAGCPAPLPVPHRATRPPHQAHFYLFLPKRSKNPQQDLGCAQPEVPEVPKVPAAPGWEAWSEASRGATELLPARSGKLLHPHTETCHHKSRAS